MNSYVNGDILNIYECKGNPRDSTIYYNLTEEDAHYITHMRD